MSCSLLILLPLNLAPEMASKAISIAEGMLHHPPTAFKQQKMI
jgi:hypothetical protein